jgi:hypothetical protein
MDLGVQTPALEPSVRLDARGRMVEVSIQSVIDQVTGERIQPEEITLIEIDWDHDGHLFQSRSQQARGMREAALHGEFSHQYQAGSTPRIAIRVCDTNGRTGFWSEKIQLE